MANRKNLKSPDTLAALFGGLQADYDATKNNRFIRRRTGLAPGGGPWEFHFRNERSYYDLIERARDMDRNDAIVGQTIDRVVANVVQDGFKLIPDTGDQKLDEELKVRWIEWAHNPDACDIAGEMCFNDFEALALRSTLLDGDCVITGTDEGPLQFFEAHTIGTSMRQPLTYLGVTLADKTRRRTKYWIARDKVGASGRAQKETAFPINVRDEDGIRQVFHVFDSKRASMTRGVTHLAPVFAVSGILEDINFAKLVQQQVVSCFAILRSMAANGRERLPGEEGYGESETETTDTGETRYIEGIQPGLEIRGKPGETLTGFSPNVPNAEYFQHFRQQISIIGANFDLAPSQVLLDFALENFVGYRGALHEARKGFRRKQSMLRHRLHHPAYVWKLAQWLSDDEALMRAATRKRNAVVITRHKWQPPQFEYLEPVKDAAGDLLRVRNNLTSRRRLHAERSQDWEEIAKESVQDNAYAIRLAKETAADINGHFPDDPNPVTWRDLISLPTPDGIQIGMTNDRDSDGGGGGGNGSEQAKLLINRQTT